jgi:hypothetical protein
MVTHLVQYLYYLREMVVSNFVALWMRRRASIGLIQQQRRLIFLEKANGHTGDKIMGRSR